MTTPGERIVLSCYLVTLSVLLVLLHAALNARPACAVDVTPRLSQAPLRTLRSKATIEGGAGGRLVLMDDFSDITSGNIQPGARTTWVEWKDLSLDTGEYQVVLLTPGCISRQTVSVQ